MESAVTSVMLNYGALGVMSLGGIYIVYYFLKEVRGLLIEIHAIVKEIKELQGMRVQDTIDYERTRADKCFEEVVLRIDKNHQELVGEIRALIHTQEKCQAANCKG